MVSDSVINNTINAETSGAMQASGVISITNMKKGKTKTIRNTLISNQAVIGIKPKNDKP